MPYNQVSHGDGYYIAASLPFRGRLLSGVIFRSGHGEQETPARNAFSYHATKQDTTPTDPDGLHS